MTYPCRSCNRDDGYPICLGDARCQRKDGVHWSDCATNNAPAYTPGPCDCGAEDADKFTPGPWLRSERPNGPWWHIGSGNQAVCTVFATSKKASPTYAAMFKANANLIAAAPELLAALRFVLSATGEQLTTAFEQAQDAIRKAEGKR